MKKIQWGKLILCLAIPLAVGGISTILTREAMEKFQTLQQPPLSPPAWLFPVVWTMLYLLMGLASYLIVTARAPERQKRKAILVYAVQLAMNFCWSLIYFNAKMYLIALFWLLVMWALIIWLCMLAWDIRRSATWCLLPYLAWVTFAAYLNFGIYLLN